MLNINFIKIYKKKNVEVLNVSIFIYYREKMWLKKKNFEYDM